MYEDLGKETCNVYNIGNKQVYAKQARQSHNTEHWKWNCVHYIFYKTMKPYIMYSIFYCLNYIFYTI